jgi:hypothetical protein
MEDEGSNIKGTRRLEETSIIIQAGILDGASYNIEIKR